MTKRYAMITNVEMDRQDNKINGKANYMLLDEKPDTDLYVINDLVLPFTEDREFRFEMSIECFKKSSTMFPYGVTEIIQVWVID